MNSFTQAGLSALGLQLAQFHSDLETLKPDVAHERAVRLGRRTTVATPQSKTGKRRVRRDPRTWTRG